MVHVTRRVLSLVLVLSALGMPAFAQAPAVVHPFDGVGAGTPAAGLALGADGFLYGTTEAPAPNGAVFRVRPNGTGFAVLHAFAPGEGVVPGHGALARGPDGVFYGTTRRGGADDRGTVYRLEVGPGGASVTTLHAFVAPDGDPDSGVILASDGLLYGTFGDGLTSASTVYRLATDGTAFDRLHILTNGVRPTGTLLEGSDGLLYGTTEDGGAHGGGTVFRLSRDGAAFTTLVDLEGHPVAGLTEAPGPDGTPHLFGVETAGQNPATEFGAIFQLRRDGTDFLRLSGFTASDLDGDTPRSPLLRGRDGALYGTATSERIGCTQDNCGTVFRVTPSGRPFSLFTFPRIVGGAPMGALVQGPDGTLYGTARVGGPAASDTAAGYGGVFAVPEPDRVPLALTGPTTSDEGGEAAYTLTLRNTTNHALTGPLSVVVTPSSGLAFTDQSVDGWSCTPQAADLLLCVWPTDLPAGVDSAPHELRFTLASPFPTSCGIGPSPCVGIMATLYDSGAAARVTTTARALSGGTFNTPPAPQDDSAPVYGTAAASIRVLDNDSDPDGDPLRVTRLLELPRFGEATINADGTITYTPVDTLIQPDTFRYEVSDSRVPTDGRASAVVTLTSSVPTLTASKTRLDLGPLAPRRIATGRFSLSSPAAMEVRIELQPVTPAEITTALQGTAYDPALAVSDPEAFRSDSRLSIDPLYPFAYVLGVHYQAPPSVGRVSVARVQIIGEPAGLAPVTRSLLIVASSADPATAPPRAVDDTTAVPVQTEVWYDVLANDGGVSTNGRPLYVSSVGGVFDFPDNDVRVPANMSAYQTGPASITGPQEMAVGTRTTVTGTATVAYSVSELDACIGAPQPGDCQLEGNMYYGYLSVEVGGTPPDLSLTLSPANLTVAPGETVTLTATVTNQGPGMASRVTVAGFTNLTQFDGLIVTPSQGTCATPAPGASLTCTLRNLLEGDSATITLQGTVPASLIPDGQTSNTLDVHASVSFGTVDSQPGDNTAVSRVTVTRPDPLPTIDFGPTVYLGCCEGTAPGAPGTIFVNLERQGDLSRESTVHYTLSAGPAPGASTDDIVGGFISGTVTFAADQVFAGVTINTTPDSLDEPDERVLLTLTSATGATLTRTSLVQAIFDDDLPQSSADVSVSLTATPQVVDVQQPVRVVAVVANGSVGEATAVVFSGLDAIVSSHTIDSVTPSQGTCEPIVAGSRVRCTLGTLPAGAAATIEIVARPTASVFQGPSQLTADVTVNALAGADEPDPSPTNNTASVVFQVRRLTADLAIAKTTASAFQHGGTATYSLAVSNVGSGPTSGSYTIGDVLPSGLSIAGLTPGAGWDCSASTATVVSCTSTTALAAGQSASVVSVNVAIATTAPDSVTNTATVAGAGETNTGNNASSVTSAILRLPTIDFGLSSASPEGTSPGPAGDITFSLDRVGDLSRESTVTYSLSAGPAPSASPDDFVGGFISGSVTFAPNQASALIRIYTTPDSIDEPDEIFLVTLTGTTGATLTRTSLGSSIADDDPPLSADLGVTLAAAPGVVDLLRPVTLTAVVTNGGPSPATNVAFTGFDSIVRTHLIDAVTASQGSCAAAASPNPLQCLLGTLASGASATVTVVARPTLTVFQGSSQYTLAVSAQAAVRADEQEPTPVNNSASTSFDVRIPIADIQLTASIAPQVVDLLQPVTITAVVRNNGPDVATNVTFRGLDLIVNTHTIDSVSVSQGSCLPPPYNYSPITCQIGTLAPGTSATITVTARPTVGVFQYDFQQEVVVNAQADATADQSDLAPANNSVLTTFRARRPAADVQLALTATPLVLDQPATYTATVTNLGPSAATNTIFRGLEFVFATHPVLSFVSSQGTCMFVPGGSAAPQCALGTLAPGASATVTIVALPSIVIFQGSSQATASVIVQGGAASEVQDPFVDNNTVTMTVEVRRNIDTTPPTITITAPVNGATFTLNQVVNASYTCTDAVGVVTCQGPVATDAAIDTATTGAKTFTVTATDAAGNQRQEVRQYSVVAPLTTCRGLPDRQMLTFAPDGSTSFNRVPLVLVAVFQACNGQGQPIGTPGFVSRFRLVRETALATGAVVSADRPVATLPAAGFRFSPAAGYWYTALDTRGLSRGRRYEYLVTLSDGTSVSFSFSIR